jgi:hypothetical protein
MTESCTCAACVDLCRKNPGWFAPDEAELAINAGLVDKLMCDWLEPSLGHNVGNTEKIFILCPAADDYAGQMAPEWDEMHGYTGSVLDGLLELYKGRCIFLENDRCAIHHSGFKPRECREQFGRGCKSTGRATNYEMARLWDNEQGRALISRWRAQVGMAEVRG